eukprot:SAG31_NODE_1739_length_7396_cov_3.063177_2_plen_107_part_00
MQGRHRLDLWGLHRTKMSVVNLLYLIKNDTPGLSPKMTPSYSCATAPKISGCCRSGGNREGERESAKVLRQSGRWSRLRLLVVRPRDVCVATPTRYSRVRGRGPSD